MFDASGRAAPHGYTVAYPSPDAPTTVTFNDAATAPAGTPARPLTCTSVTEPAANTPIPENNPSTVAFAPRLSNTRAGTTGTSELPAGKAVAGVYTFVEELTVPGWPGKFTHDCGTPPETFTVPHPPVVHTT